MKSWVSRPAVLSWWDGDRPQGRGQDDQGTSAIVSPARGAGAGPKAPTGARERAGFRRLPGTEQPVPGEDTSRLGQERCWSH